MDEMSSADRDRLLSRFGRTLAPGAVLFREGDQGNEAFLLQEGRVRLLKRIRAMERNLMVLRPGDLFGEGALLPGCIRSSTAIAITDVVVLALDRTTFLSLLESQPEVTSRLMQQLIRRLRDAEDQMEIMMLRDTQSKIVAALLKAASQAGMTAHGAPVRVSLSPMELSTRVGLDIEAVKRGVQRLREGQYVRVVNEMLEVTDIDALQQLFALLGVKDEIRGVSESGTGVNG